MENAIIGAILRKRIKEKGYTQEEFAEKAGIGKATLTKYMSGENTYSICMLEKFAIILECSYDYLMGKSKSPIRENQEISNVLRLSDKAIGILRERAGYYELNFTRKRYIETMNAIIETDGLVQGIADYFIGSKQNDKEMMFFQQMSDELVNLSPIIAEHFEKEDVNINGDTLLLIDIVNKLAQAKYNLPKELLEEIKKLEKEVDFEKIKNDLFSNIIT